MNNNTNLYAVKSQFVNSVCIKQVINGYEISAAFDDSSGASDTLNRGDIRIWRVSDDENVTEQVQADFEQLRGSVIIATIENLALCAQWAKKQ